MMRPVEAWILVLVFALILMCLTALNNPDKKIRENNMGVAALLGLGVMGWAFIKILLEIGSGG